MTVGKRGDVLSLLARCGATHPESCWRDTHQSEEALKQRMNSWLFVIIVLYVFFSGPIVLIQFGQNDKK